jgi:hypothetical protein
MGSQRGTKLAFAALAGAAGVLAWLDYRLLQDPVDISPVAPASGKAIVRSPQSPKPVTALDKKAPEQFPEIVGRPLFNPSRRPVQPAEPAVVRAPKMEPSKLRLVGVMKPDEGPPRALIRYADEPAGRWIAEGGEYRGWTLTKVNENSVIVEAGGRTQELMLFVPPPPQKAAPLPAPALPPSPQQPADPKAEAAPRQ